jgi:hypothetical protein
MHGLPGASRAGEQPFRAIVVLPRHQKNFELLVVSCENLDCFYRRKKTDKSDAKHPSENSYFHNFDLAACSPAQG